MSPRPKKRARCEGCKKRVYPRRAMALEVIAGMKKRGLDRLKPGVLHVYPCPFGLGWHVGHTRWASE